MSTATATNRRAARDESVVLATLRARPRLWALLAVVIGWIAIWSFTEGTHTLAISTSTRTDVHQWFQDVSNWVETAVSSQSSWVINALGSLADALDSAFSWLQELFTVAPYPRPLPAVRLAGHGRARHPGHLRGRGLAAGPAWWCPRSCSSASSATGPSRSTPC